MEEEEFKRVDDKNIHITINSTYKRTPELESMLADLALHVEGVCNVLQKEIDDKLEEITHPGGRNIEKMEVEVKALKFLVNDAVGLVMNTFKAGFGIEAYTHDKKMAKLILDKVNNGLEKEEDEHKEEEEDEQI